MKRRFKLPHLHAIRSVFFIGSWLAFAACAAAGTSPLLADIRYLSSEQMHGRETGTDGAALARAYLKTRFRQLELQPWQGQYSFPFSYRQGRKQQHGVNLVAWLPGCDADSGSIVLTAHYDHLGKRGRRVFFGANDNASGVAIMLALANKLQAAKQSCTRHHYFFVATDAEENGLHGSRAFVTDPPVALDRILLNINLDMLARSQPQGQLFITGARRFPELRARLQQQSADVRLLFLGHRGPQQRGSLLRGYDWPNSSDHAHFHRQGIPYLFFGGMPFADYHSVDDQWERIDAEFLQQVLAVIWQTLLWVESSTKEQLRP